MPEALTISHLSVRFDGEAVLEDIDFAVSAGDYVGLSGPNGAGKTTLVKSVLGLVPIFSGRIEILGEPLPRFREFRRIGYLPQRAASFNSLFPATVREVVGLGLLAEKRAPKRFFRKDRERVTRALELFELAYLKNKLVTELSGGEQQRVLLARAVVSEPDLLILDEPITALDPTNRDNFFAVLARLNSEQGITIILITHDLGSIGQYASKFLYLDKQVIFYGRFSDFCQSPEMSRHFGDYSQHVICHQHD